MVEEEEEEEVVEEVEHVWCNGSLLFYGGT